MWALCHSSFACLVQSYLTPSSLFSFPDKFDLRFPVEVMKICLRLQIITSWEKIPRHRPHIRSLAILQVLVEVSSPYFCPHFWIIRIGPCFKSHLPPKVPPYIFHSPCAGLIPVLWMSQQLCLVPEHGIIGKKEKIQKKLRWGEAGIGKLWFLGQIQPTACFYE